MKKIINKKNIVILITVAFTLFILESNSFAMGLQARDSENPLGSKNVSTFFELIRAMETPTGTLGKNSNINTNTDYLDTTGNGIDCHLQKNTEYGTLTLLAASEYGNKPNSNNNYTTGNNNTGVRVWRTSSLCSKYTSNI